MCKITFCMLIGRKALQPPRINVRSTYMANETALKTVMQCNDACRLNKSSFSIPPLSSNFFLLMKVDSFLWLGLWGVSWGAVSVMRQGKIYQSQLPIKVLFKVKLGTINHHLKIR